MMDLLLKNGLVVMENETGRKDIAIKDGIIQEIGENISVKASRVIDLDGKVILPGGIEGHMHTKAPFQGAYGALDFFEQSKCAAFGGITTFMDFANVYGEDVISEQVRIRLHEMSHAAIDFSCHAKIIGTTKNIDSEIKKLVDLGVPTFKIFMTYKKEGVMTEDETILKIFASSKKYGAMPMFHCESNSIYEHNLEMAIEENDLSWKRFAQCKPTLCEAEAFGRVLGLAQLNHSALVIVHTTNEMCFEKARSLLQQEYPVYVESCPHYITLFDDLYEREDGYLAICSPPLRTPKEKDEIWQAIEEGTVNLIGSDDCTFDVHEKSMFLEKDENGKYIQDFRRVVNGLNGIELRLPILLSEGVHQGRITIERVAQLTATNEAKIYGMYPQKGVIQEGSDADFAVVDLDLEKTVTKDLLHNETSYSLYEGLKLKGWPVMTIRRGEVLVEKDEFYGRQYTGKKVHRKISKEILDRFALNTK